MSIRSLPLTIALLLTALFGVACQPDADGSATASSEVASFEHQLLSTLTVADDGTLGIRDAATFEALLGDEHSAALADLERLNARIRAGVVDGFDDESQLFDFDIVGAFSADPMLKSNERCRDTCTFGTCCVRGWWIFCWGYGTC